jgi:hypothetical protein
MLYKPRSLNCQEGKLGLHTNTDFFKPKKAKRNKVEEHSDWLRHFHLQNNHHHIQQTISHKIERNKTEEQS